jgi:hypothetical protein
MDKKDLSKSFPFFLSKLFVFLSKFFQNRMDTIFIVHLVLRGLPLPLGHALLWITGFTNLLSDLGGSPCSALSFEQNNSSDSFFNLHHLI